MYVKTKLGAILVAASTLSVALPNGRRNNDPAKKAVYFLQNNPAGASVIALDLVDGHIADPVRTSTQGIGVGAVNMTSGEAANIDTLNSQSAVTVGGSYLFAVNAGSNTLATFNIDEADPVHPQLIGQPTDTLGDFPVSVTYSDELNTVCVLNGGKDNNVACWTIKDFALHPSGDVRPLGIDYLLTPPISLDGTFSRISFSPDSSKLVVTLKGKSPTAPGTVFFFPVKDGVVTRQPIKTTIPDLPTPFGFAFGESSDNVLISDPSFGGSVVTIDATTSTATELIHTVSPQKAACWAAYSPATKHGYLFDAAGPLVSELDMTTGATLGVLAIDAAFNGAFDSVIDGTTAYFLSAVASVGVFDVAKNATVQNLDLSGVTGVDSRQWWTGIAMYPA